MADETSNKTAVAPAQAEPIDPDTGLSLSQMASTYAPQQEALKAVGSRLQEPVKQSEVEKVPGLQPEKVQQLQEAGQDTLGSIFGKEKGDYIREHILNGFTPEVTARAAAKSLTDWYSPAMLALSAPGRIAHGYAAAAKAAEEAGNVAQAAVHAGKARLAGALGTIPGIPMLANQAHDLMENWSTMTPAERTAAISGLVGGTVMTGVGVHAGATAGAQKIHEAGAQARENISARQDAKIQEAKTGKVLTVEPEKPAAKPQAALPAAPESATENPVSDHIEFSKFGGKEVKAPEKPIAHEIKKEGPQWDRTHSAVDATGKKIGSVGYKVDPDGQAQIYGSVVDPTLRGQGIGQNIYRSVIDEARESGASSITSDSTNTTPEANRVWEKLRDKGLPVENITHPNGKPGYQIDFENPPEPQPEKEYPEQKFESTLARRGQIPGQTVNLSDSYGDTGGYVGGHAEYRPPPGSAGEAIAHQRAIERAGTTTGNALLDIPQHLMPEGSTTHDVVTHEIAHGVMADLMGLSTEGSEVQSHLHPSNAGRGNAAAITIDLSKIPGTKAVLGQPGLVDFSKQALVDAWPKFLPTWLAGGVAQELIHGIPFESNTGLTGDMRQLHKIGEMMGFTPEETQGMIDGSVAQTREMLNHPATLDIIKKSASEREEGLSKTLHTSATKLQDVIRQVKEARNEGTAKATGANAGTVVPENEPSTAGAGSEGDVRKSDGEAVSSSLEARKVKDSPVVAKAVEHYGTTDDIKKAGYILPDGRLLDFSDGQSARVLDHGDVSQVYGAEGTENPREQFVADSGAVRIIHSPRQNYVGLHFDLDQPPTDSQLEHVANLLKDGTTVEADISSGDTEKTGNVSPYVGSNMAKASDMDGLRRIVADARKDAQQKVAAGRGAYALSQSLETNKGPQVSPNTALQASAQKYAKTKGMPEISHEPVEVDPARAKEIAKIYDEAQHDPDDSKVKAAYDALKSETKDQFHHLRDDLGLKFEPQEKDPYKSAGEMMKDVKQNNRLKVFTGSSTGADHPLSEIDPETGHSYNTLFRWVHDAMGHAAGGNDFSEGGEKSATEAHAQMYSDAARPAMRAETEGQTSWFFHNPEVESGAAKPGKFAEQKATIMPDVSADWHKAAGESAAKNEAGGINPRTGKSDSKGFGTEIMPELRQPLDHAPTAEDFKNFYDQHKDIFDKHPELRVGWDNKSAVAGGHEINVGAVGPDASRVAKKLDQKSAFNITKGEVVPTGGTGLRTAFPNYPIEDRIKDLTNQKQSDISGFEHVSKDVYDHLEPDERDYIKGDKNLQRNLMAQYHKIAPSVPETTNAMQAGAALSGWWKRYIDVFHDLVGEGGKTIGGKQPEGKLLYHYTKTPFDTFDPMIGGEEGDFGTHLGTMEQAHGRMTGAEGITDSDAPHIRPVYANIKNPLRLTDDGSFEPHQIAAQLLDQGLLSQADLEKMSSQQGNEYVDPEKLRDFLEEKGYDGIVYLNRAEGIPLDVAANDRSGDDEDFLEQHPEAKGNDSYIALHPEQMTPKYSADQIANTIGPSHAEILKQWHAALSANKSVGDANNLAWHSYADWLDAGKPTDRKSINDIILKNGAQPEGSGKKGNAAISDTLGRKGKIVHEGIDTSKIFNLVNSPEMRGERPFSGDVFRDDAKNPLMGKGEGYRKVPSMGATVAGKGNLNRLVIDTHIADFYGQDVKGTAARYIADSAHLRQAAKALGLKGGEGQEQLWGTVLGLKTLLKQGLTPAEAGGKLNADVINNIGKDYAEIIANDPEITRPGGILDRLKDKYGIGRGSAGVGTANIQTPSTNASEGGPAGSQAGVDPSLLGETAGRIRGTISESKIKKPAAEPEDEDTSFAFGANVESKKPSARPAGKVKGKVNAVDLLRMLGGLKNPGKP